MQLLSHIIRHNALSQAIDWGVREEDFLTDEGRAVFQHMMMMKRDPRFAGAQPGQNVMKQVYPNFDICDDTSMTLEAYCTMVRENKFAVEVQAIAREMVTGAGTAADRALHAAERIQRNITSIGYGARNDVEFAESLAFSAEEHDLQASGVDLSVGRWPWEPFNTTSNGLQEDDYIVFYGRPKSKKSWVLAEFIASLYMQGKSTLVYTKEMTANNIFRRVGACIAKLPYQEFRTGRLTRDERLRLANVIDAARDIRDHQRMICLDGKDSNGSDTVEWLHAKVKKHRPNVVFIDGMYLMSDGKGVKGQKDNMRVQGISRALRQMVLSEKIPVIATIQATRGAAAHKNANLDEIAFSDAIGQDVTGAVRVINEDEAEQITLVVGGSREYRFSGCRIWGVPATDFSFIENLSQKEIDKIRQRDDRQDEKESGTETNGAQPTAKRQAPKAAIKSDRKIIDERLRNTPRSLRIP